MKTIRGRIYEAALAGDLVSLRRLVEGYSQLNRVGPGELSLLEDVLMELCHPGIPHKYAVVRILLECGADPNKLSGIGSSPLLPPMLGMDTKMLRLLLKAGADPNKAGGFTKDSSFYDWAESDYRTEVYDLKLSDKPRKGDQKDADSWLAFLDRIAVKYNRRRPDHLLLLRKYGAKTMKEIMAEQGEADG